MERIEVIAQSQIKKSRLKEAPVTVYRIIEVPPEIEGVSKKATIKIIPKVELEDDASNQSNADKVDVVTSFLIDDHTLKKSQVIRLPIPIRHGQRKLQTGLNLDEDEDDSGSGNEFLVRNFPCDICKKTFKHSSHLKRHINTHTGERVHKCDLCEKKFLDTSTLSRHRKIHSGDKPWSCKICKKSFGTLGSLRRHITVHNQEGRPYQCESCQKRFPDNSSYQKHKLIHTGIKPHICDICKKAFVHIGDLNGHRKIHVEIKPYNCERCGKDFAKHSNYARHVLIHEGDKEFSCMVCGVSYNYRSSLTRHLLTHIPKGYKTSAECASKGTLPKCFLEDESLPKSDEASSQEPQEPTESTKRADVPNMTEIDASELPVKVDVPNMTQIRVRRTKMRNVNKFKYLHKLQGLTQSEKHDVVSTLPDVITTSPAENSEQNPSEPASNQQAKQTSNTKKVEESDPTVLPPQDEIILKQTTTEDVTSLLTSAEDFGSTKDIPQPLLPPLLELVPRMPKSESLKALLEENDSEIFLSRNEDSLRNSEAAISNADSVITIISITNNALSLPDGGNVESSGSENSDLVVVLESGNHATSESELRNVCDAVCGSERINKQKFTMSYGGSSK